MAKKKEEGITRLKNLVEGFLEKNNSMEMFCNPKNTNAVADVNKIKNCIFENLIHPAQAEDLFRNIEKKLYLEWDANETVQARLYDTDRYYESEILKMVESKKHNAFKEFVDSNPTFLKEAIEGFKKTSIVNDRKTYYSARFICYVYEYIKPFWERLKTSLRTRFNDDNLGDIPVIEGAFEQKCIYQIEFKDGWVKINEKRESKIMEIIRYSFISLLNDIPIDVISECDICKHWFIKKPKNRKFCSKKCSNTNKQRNFRNNNRDICNERSKQSMKKNYQKKMNLPVKDRPKTSRQSNQSD